MVLVKVPVTLAARKMLEELATEDGRTVAQIVEDLAVQEAERRRALDSVASPEQVPRRRRTGFGSVPEFAAWTSGTDHEGPDAASFSLEGSVTFLTDDHDATRHIDVGWDANG